MRIAVLADDLTGAADTGVQLVRAGYRTAVIFRGEPLPEDFDAVVIDTDTRTKRARQAVKRVSEAAREVRGAEIIYKKLDSTLRGSIAAEISVTLEATHLDRAIVAPAFPGAGRTTVDGVQLVHGVPVHETEMRNDPRTPVTEGHIPTLLRETLSSAETLNLEELEDPEIVQRKLEESTCVVVDATRDADLETLVRAVPEPMEVLWVGSAGLAGALGVVYPGPGVEESRSEARAASRVLVVVGSVSGVARGQLRRLTEEYGEVSHSVRADGADAVKEAVEEARRALDEGPCAVLHSPEERGEKGSSGKFVKALTEAVEILAQDDAFDALVLTGGSTAMGVSRVLGASGIRLDGEVEAGVPVGAMIGPHPCRVVTKAGAFGTEDTLVQAVKTLLQSGEEHNT